MTRRFSVLIAFTLLVLVGCGGFRGGTWSGDRFEGTGSKDSEYWVFKTDELSGEGVFGGELICPDGKRLQGESVMEDGRGWPDEWRFTKMVRERDEDGSFYESEQVISVEPTDDQDVLEIDIGLRSFFLYRN